MPIKKAGLLKRKQRENFTKEQKLEAIRDCLESKSEKDFTHGELNNLLEELEIELELDD